MGRKISYIFLSLFLLLVIFLAARFFLHPKNPTEGQGGPEKIKVSASFYPLYYFAAQIGGEKAAVVNITPAGAEPHDFEPTARAIADIQGSRLLILNGAGLEPWSSDILQNIDPKKTAVIIAGEGLADIRETEKTDPHVWLSPLLAESMVKKIIAGFVGADPLNAGYYEDNGAKLLEKLDLLDRDYRTSLSGCSEKSFVTAHAAFAYLAAAYGLRQVPISGLSPEEEPSPRQLAEITDFVKANQIRYIFFESLASPKLADAIATETGAKTLILNPIEGLTPADLAAGKDYLSEMRNNLQNLRIALKCQ